MGISQERNARFVNFKNASLLVLSGRRRPHAGRPDNLVMHGAKYAGFKTSFGLARLSPIPKAECHMTAVSGLGVHLKVTLSEDWSLKESKYLQIWHEEWSNQVSFFGAFILHQRL